MPTQPKNKPMNNVISYTHSQLVILILDPLQNWWYINSTLLTPTIFLFCLPLSVF